jgi:hypothetical protein
MGKLTSTNAPPRGLYWKIEVDGRTLDSEEEFFDSIRNMAKGDAMYMKTNFRDKIGRNYYPVRQRNFKDGYWMYTIWFKRKTDAALFRLFNG